jgi:Ni/Fe-hydrogenase 1 B-type cytochrome subunit
MAQREAHTVYEHPLPAVIMHWFHLVTFLILAFTGLVIHFQPLGWPMSTVINLHFLAMFVFVATAVTRIYWAFLGRGSARLGEERIERDYHHFAINGTWARNFWPYAKYYLFIAKKRPKIAKYNPLQSLTYGYLFPLLILCMALTGFALYGPFASAFAWVTAAMGGLNNVRLVHFLLCCVMIAVFLIHLYLVVMEEPVQVYSMLFHVMPEKYRPAFVRERARAAEGAG